MNIANVLTAKYYYLYLNIHNSCCYLIMKFNFSSEFLLKSSRITIQLHTVIKVVLIKD